MAESYINNGKLAAQLKAIDTLEREYFFGPAFSHAAGVAKMISGRTRVKNGQTKLSVRID